MMAGLLPHWAMVAKDRARIAALAMSRDPASPLRRRVAEQWGKLRDGRETGGWVLELWKDIERTYRGLQPPEGGRDLAGSLDFGLLGGVEEQYLRGAAEAAAGDVRRVLPAGLEANERWNTRVPPPLRRYRGAVNEAVVREMVLALTGSVSGTYLDLWKLLLAEDGARGWVPAWEKPDPTEPFPFAYARRDWERDGEYAEAARWRARAGSGRRYMYGANKWKAGDDCKICRAGRDSDWGGSDSRSLEHLVLCCPEMQDVRAQAAERVRSALASWADQDMQVMLEALTALGGGTAVTVLEPKVRRRWVCLVLGFPADVPFLPGWSHAPGESEESKTTARRRVRVLNALAPVAAALSRVRGDPMR